MERIYLNDGWKFTEKFDERMVRRNFDESGLKEVRLPHTCKETPFHYFDEHIYQMVSGYRRRLFVPEEWREKRVLITIEGAAHESTVFLNGQKIGEHHCGYTAFSIDLSENLRYGEENILAVRVDSRESLNIPPFGHVIDYMTYGGIYRDVYLEVRNPVYLKDVFVRSEFTSERDAVLISEAALNEETQGYVIRQSMRKKGETQSVPLGECKAEAVTKLSFPVKNVSLWDVEQPALYEIKTELVWQGRVLDKTVTVFGFREAQFRRDGFYLNGRKLKIRGLNRHQCFPYVGYAMPESMQKRDADLLKRELGVNAVRTSHYPQSHYFLDRCDELGLLVFTELPGWQHIGDAAWKEQAVENVRDMVRQYRNHPSVILWGVRINESQDDDGFYAETNRVARSLDPSRQTGGVRANKKSSLLEDVYTYNDFLHEGDNRGCEKKSAVTSDVTKPYLVSEYNGHMYPTKAYDCEEHRVEHALRHANVMDALVGEEEIAGGFGWCMFDYNTHKDFGSGDRVCYHGVMDMFRNPKLAAAVYACEQERKPVLEVASSMDIGEHPGCHRGAVWIFTNADSVRMYKNDSFVKEFRREDSPYRNLCHGPLLVDDFIGDALERREHMKPAQAEKVKTVLNTVARFGLGHLTWAARAAAAELVLLYHMKMKDAVELYTRYVGDWGGVSTVYRFEAVKDGKIVKTAVKEPMTALRLSVEADRLCLEEKNSYEVAAVRIQAQDQNGNLLHFFNDPIVLETEGAIELIGPGVLSLQGGMGGAYIRTTGIAGTGRLKVVAAGIKTQELQFNVIVHSTEMGGENI